jgi:hypothetical protein
MTIAAESDDSSRRAKQCPRSLTSVSPLRGEETSHSIATDDSQTVAGG